MEEMAVFFPVRRFILLYEVCISLPAFTGTSFVHIFRSFDDSCQTLSENAQCILPKIFAAFKNFSLEIIAFKILFINLLRSKLCSVKKRQALCCFILQNYRK